MIWEINTNLPPDQELADFGFRAPAAIGKGGGRTSPPFPVVFGTGRRGLPKSMIRGDSFLIGYPDYIGRPSEPGKAKRSNDGHPTRAVVCSGNGLPAEARPGTRSWLGFTGLPE